VKKGHTLQFWLQLYHYWALTARLADVQEGDSQICRVKHDECWNYSLRVAVAGVVGRAGEGGGPGDGGRGEVVPEHHQR
jgi:hypothetical protein